MIILTLFYCVLCASINYTFLGWLLILVGLEQDWSAQTTSLGGGIGTLSSNNTKSNVCSFHNAAKNEAVQSRSPHLTKNFNYVA